MIEKEAEDVCNVAIGVLYFGFVDKSRNRVRVGKIDYGGGIAGRWLIHW